LIFSLCSTLSSDTDSPYTQSSFSTAYFDTLQLSEKFQHNNKLSLMSLNIQSLPSKYEQLKELISDLSLKGCTPVVICLQETFNILDCSLFPLQNYQPLIFINRTSSAGGGVGIYLKTNLTFKILKDKSTFIDKLYESLFLEIQTSKGKKMIVASIYRTNSKYSNMTSAEQFTQFNEILLNTLSSLNTNVDTYLLGDFNIDVLKYESSKQVSTYIDNLFSLGLLQTITKPTRCTNTSATLIDLAVTNSVSMQYTTAILTKKISDHFPFIVYSNMCLAKNTKTTITMRDFSDQ
jgi:exonuclease III